MGDNIIYKPPKITNYHDGLELLGREGIRGLFKGNFTGILMNSANIQLRTFLYQFIEKDQSLNPLLKASFSINFSNLSNSHRSMLNC